MSNICSLTRDECIGCNYIDGIFADFDYQPTSSSQIPGWRSRCLGKLGLQLVDILKLENTSSMEERFLIVHHQDGQAVSEYKFGMQGDELVRVKEEDRYGRFGSVAALLNYMKGLLCGNMNLWSMAMSNLSRTKHNILYNKYCILTTIAHSCYDRDTSPRVGFGLSGAFYLEGA